MATAALEARTASHSETDVLTLEELRAALKISRSQLYKVLPRLKVSYALGEKSPRVVWGDVLAYLRETSEN